MLANESSPSGAWATASTPDQAAGGFWRTLGASAAVYLALTALTYGLARVAGPPWAEIVNVVTLLVCVLGIWRLAPGRGPLLWRVGRVLSWAVLFGIVTGALVWAINRALPIERSFLGLDPDSLTLSPGVFIASSIAGTLVLALPVRMLQSVWRASRAQLRWQLTLSHIVIGAGTTLLVFVAISLYISFASLTQVPLFVAPADAAARIGAGLTPLVEQNASDAQLQAALDGILAGRVRLPVAEDRAAEENGRQEPLDGVRRVTLLDADGQVRASASRTGGALPAPLPALDPDSLTLLLGSVRGGGCANGRPAGGTLIDSAACAIVDARGTLQATVVVETPAADPSAQRGAALGRIIGIFATVLIAVIGGLALTSVFILLLAGGLGYLLARNVIRPLEQLARATSAIAAGDLSQRVAVEAVDEIGQLGANFNAMAARLEEREQALRAETERSAHLLHANRRLTADVSHELRTPLTTLRGYVEALAETHADALPAHDLTVIQAEIERLTKLIDDLFLLARAEARQLPLTVVPLDPAPLVHDLVATIAPLARRERQIEVVAQLPSVLPPVYADRTRLEQVLLNLVQNALRHTPAGGIVVIEARAAEAEVLLAVADTGVGILPDEVPLVFERFYRGDSSRARETGGAGLGLALVKELVGAMDGHVAVESEPGRGSRFTVGLRRADEQRL